MEVLNKYGVLCAHLKRGAIHQDKAMRLCGKESDSQFWREHDRDNAGSVVAPSSREGVMAVNRLGRSCKCVLLKAVLEGIAGRKNG